MPPWKLAGVDISNFRTARPHQSPGTSPVTTTPVAPTNSLPMPPGTSTPSLSSAENSGNGPHPPAPPPQSSAESSGLPSSSEQEEEASAQNTTVPSSTEELMTLGVTETNMKTEKPDKGVLKILSPVFEDITKIDNISDSEEVLRVNSENSVEGSGDNEPELMTTLETTTTSSKKSSEFTTTMTPESSSVTTTTAKPVTEPITTSTSSTSATTTLKTSSKIRDEVTTTMMPEMGNRRNLANLHPTKGGWGEEGVKCEIVTHIPLSTD